MRVLWIVVSNGYYKFDNYLHVVKIGDDFDDIFGNVNYGEYRYCEKDTRDILMSEYELTKKDGTTRSFETRKTDFLQICTFIWMDKSPRSFDVNKNNPFYNWRPIAICLVQKKEDKGTGRHKVQRVCTSHKSLTESKTKLVENAEDIPIRFDSAQKNEFLKMENMIHDDEFEIVKHGSLNLHLFDDLNERNIWIWMFGLYI